MKLKTGRGSHEWVSCNNTRGAAFHGMGAFVGTGKAQRAHVYTAHPCPSARTTTKRSTPRNWRKNSKWTCAPSTTDASG